jgi:tetratricopeptide (TPR) repeat protein
MKKEVSAEFVVSLLDGWSEEEVLAYIGRYSKWFNSPVSGLYALYHERFRAFVLQKISGSQLGENNSRVIKSCNDALTRQLNDEWERYALEFLSAHLVMPSLENNNRGNELKELAYNTTYWNRQIEVSKGFDWSKRLLNDMMFWASKYDDDQVIECALNKVDLHHMEQNDAPRIVELVAQNDIETALQRIESFGGNDKEGLQRKFLLYMLCFMELTLLDSKDKPFRKTAIGRLLKHLDEILPTDLSILKWNDFFPSYLMFQLASECAALGADYGVLYKRSDRWETDWIAEKGPYTDLQIQVLKGCARSISDEDEKRRALKDIDTELSKLDRLEGSLAIARGISDEEDKNMNDAIDCAKRIIYKFHKVQSLANISTKLYNQGKVEAALSLMDEVQEYARGMDEESDKIRAMIFISNELDKQSKFEEAHSLLLESIQCCEIIKNEDEKAFAFHYISSELARRGQFNEAFKCVDRISSKNSSFSSALFDISKELSKHGRFKEAIDCAQRIKPTESEWGYYDDELKIKALNNIFAELNKQEINDNLNVSKNFVIRELKRVSTPEEILSLFAKLNLFKDAAIIIQEFISLNKGILDNYEKNNLLYNISRELFNLKQNKFGYACIDSMIPGRSKVDAFIDFFQKLYNEGKVQEAGMEINKVLKCVQDLNDDKDDTLGCISDILAKQGRFKDALECVQNIDDKAEKCLAYSRISNEFAKIGQYKDAEIILKLALANAQGILYGKSKIRLLESLINEMALNEMIKQLTLSQIQFYIRDFYGEEFGLEYFDRALRKMSIEFAKDGNIAKAKKCAQGISEDLEKIGALVNISSELARQGKADQAASFIKEALAFIPLACSEYHSAEFLNDRALTHISIELCKQGNVTDALVCVNKITDDEFKDKSKILKDISIQIVKDGKVEGALECAQGIVDGDVKYAALIGISNELFKSEKLKEAESTLQAVLSSVNFIEDNSRILEDISEALVTQGKFNEAIKCSLVIGEEYYRNTALSNICKELARLGNLTLAECVSLEITQIGYRQECWEYIAESICKESGFHNSYQLQKYFQNAEVKSLYLKGLADVASVIEMGKEQILMVFRDFPNHIQEVEKVLNLYALHENFFSEFSEDRLERLNGTLNIRWAVNVRNKLN